MAQASPTTCAHNAPGQVVRTDIAVACRQCGAQIKTSPRAGNVPSQGAINAVYPGDASTASSTWAFSQ